MTIGNVFESAVDEFSREARSVAEWVKDEEAKLAASAQVRLGAARSKFDAALAALPQMAVAQVPLQAETPVALGNAVSWPVEAVS